MDEHDLRADIQQACQELFSHYSWEDNRFNHFLSKTIIDCFQLKTRTDNFELKSILILKYLILKVHPSFDFEQFIYSLNIPKPSLKIFLSALIQSLYFKDVTVFSLSQLENPSWLFLQILAENLSLTDLKKILSELSLQEKLQLLHFSFKNYREGSFPLHQAFEHLYSKNNNPEASLMLKLLTGFKRKYYDLNALKQFLKEKNTLPSLNDLTDFLDTKFEEQIYEIKNLLENLIKSIVPSQGSIFSLEEYKEFFQLYGLKDHIPPFPHVHHSYHENHLLDKLKFIQGVFSDSKALQALSPIHHNFYQVFVRTIFDHMDTLIKKPEKYEKALETFVFGIPTAGKDLARLPGLTTTVQAYKNCIEILQSRGCKNRDLKEIPLFVFDQSSPELFESNHLFIDRLNKEYGCWIVHLSRQDILKIAQKMKIAALIDTTHLGHFGYGGMRNSLFLLLPLLKHLYAKHSSLEEILNLDFNIVKEIFNQHVLGTHPEIPSNTIFMLDDDMLIHDANLFSHLSLSMHSQSLYLASQGYEIGRLTKKNLRYPRLETFLEQPTTLFSHQLWNHIPTPCLMSEYVGHPPLCVNLPMGGEELLTRLTFSFDLLSQCSFHLGGHRLPWGHWPTHYALGVDEYLNKYIPYSIYIALVEVFIDPVNAYGQNIYPWMDRSFTQRAKNLHETLKILSDKKIYQEMQKRFWNNLKRFLNFSIPPLNFLQEDFKNLLESPFDEIIQAHLEKENIPKDQQNPFIKIARVYTFYQQDAQYFMQLAQQAVQFPLDTHLDRAIENLRMSMEENLHIHLEHFPLTYGLYLMLLHLGAAQFNRQLGKILETYSIS